MDNQETEKKVDDFLERFPTRKREPINPEKVAEAKARARVIPEIEQITQLLQNGTISEAAARRKLAEDRIAAEKKARRAAEKAKNAYIDGLTGLPNRNAFEEKFEEMVYKDTKLGGKVSIMFLDNEGLKPVNDELGQGAGDALLAVTAANLKLAVGKDGQVYRYGGDEWVVYVKGDIDKGRLVFEGIDTKLKPTQKMRYLMQDGSEGEFSRAIRVRATLSEVNPENPLMSLAKTKTNLPEAKTQQKGTGKNLLLVV